MTLKSRLSALAEKCAESMHRAAWEALTRTTAFRQKFDAVADSLSQIEIAISNVEEGVLNQFPANEHRADLLEALALIRKTLNLTREAVAGVSGESKVVDTESAPTYKVSNEPQ